MIVSGVVVFSVTRHQDLHLSASVGCSKTLTAYLDDSGIEGAQIAPGQGADLVWIFGNQSLAKYTSLAGLAKINTTSISNFAVDPQGATWVLDINNDRIGKLQSDGTLNPSVLIGNNSNTSFSSFVITADGTIWLSNYGSDGRIRKLLLNGTFTDYPVSSTDANIGYSIARGPDGAVWFADGNNIDRIASDGSITRYPLPSPNSHPSSMVLGSDNALWFTAWGKIGRLSLSGQVTEFTVPSLSPEKIVEGPDGALWYWDINRRVLARMTKDGVYTERSFPALTNFFFSNLVNGGDGNLWFTAAPVSVSQPPQARRIFKFACGEGLVYDYPGSTTLTSSTTQVTPIGGSSSASSIAIDCSDIVCGDGTKIPRCNSGVPISYNSDPCAGHASSSAASFSIGTTFNDPGFELPVVPSGAPGYILNPASGSPWTFASNGAGNGAVATNYVNGYAGANPPAPQGNQVGVLQMAGSISQTVNLQAGFYSLSFSAAQRVNTQASYQVIRITMDGLTIADIQPTGSTYATYDTGVFSVPTSGTHVVTFTGLNPQGGDNTAFIDQVNLQPINYTNSYAVLSSFNEPSFEFPVMAPGYYGFAYSPTGTPWAWTFGAGIAANGSGFASGNPPSPSGKQVAFIQGTGSMSQPINVEAGNYNVTFSIAQRVNSQTAPQVVRVLWNNVVIGEVTAPSANYTQQSLPISLATSGPYTLKFVGLNTQGDSTALIDQVSLVPTAGSSSSSSSSSASSHIDVSASSASISIPGVSTSSRSSSSSSSSVPVGVVFSSSKSSSSPLAFPTSVAVTVSSQTVNGQACGNASKGGLEQCDDGNTQSGDGCSSACMIESGWSCVGARSICTRQCGNGVQDTGEACDDQNTQSGDGCSASCALETGYACEGTWCGALCGDGLIKPPEECDDHNGQSGDGCSDMCEAESGFSCSGTPSVCKSLTTVGKSSPKASSVAPLLSSQAIAVQPGTTTYSSVSSEGVAVLHDAAQQPQSIVQGPLPAAACPADACASGGGHYCSLQGKQCENLSHTPCYQCIVGASRPSSDVVIAHSTVSSIHAPVFGPTLPFTFTAISSAPSPTVNTAVQPSSFVPVQLRAQCGNGIVEAGEQCDFGTANSLQGSRCTPQCMILQTSSAAAILAATTQQNPVSLFQQILNQPQVQQPSPYTAYAPSMPAYNQPVQLQPLLASAPTHAPVGATGPGSLGAMAAGAASGIAYVRRKRKSL